MKRAPVTVAEVRLESKALLRLPAKMIWQYLSEVKLTMLSVDGAPPMPAESRTTQPKKERGIAASC